MAKQNNRPTATNYQDYLLDYSGVDLSRYRGQVEESPEAQTAQPEAGTWDKVRHTAAAIGEGLTMLPGGFVDTVRDAWRGGDIDVTDAEAQREREERAREQAAYVEKYRGKAFDGVADAMVSMPYSLATMGASLGGGVLGSLGGPVGSAAGGLAASGTVAYRASKQNFMETMLGETTKLLGRRPTQEEWDAIAREFDDEATQYGLWEAGPEALSNLFMGKLLGPLGKRFFSGGIGATAKRAAGLYGEEFATETITQMGQGSIEADLGLRDSAPGVLQALGEIAPATFWQTTLMAGGKKGLDALARRRAAQRDERQTETDVVAGEEQGPSAAAQPPAPETDGRTAGPETAQEDGGMPDGAPVAEAAADGVPDRIAPEAGRMERGEHVDLLREDGGPLPATDRAGQAGPAAREESAGEASPPVEGADSLPERADAPVLPPVPGGLTEAVPVPEAEGTPQEPGRALPLPARMRTTDAAQGVPPADREGQAGAGQAVVPERPAPLGPPQDMRPGERPAGMRPAMPEAATPAMPEVLPNILPQSGPEVGPGAAVPPQAETGLPATAPVATPAPSAEARPGPEVSQLGRGELLRLLPEEQRAAARRMTTPRIRELVRQAAQQPLPAGESRILSAEEVHHAQENGSGRRQSAAGPGMGQGDGGTGIHAVAEYAGRQGREGDGTGAAGHAAEGDGRGRTLIKIPQRDDEPARFALMEADEVQASHLPEFSFQRNPRYGLENERRYHDEPASRQKVLENAARLDPAFLLESVDAAHGAPIVDRQGNVLGGNGRAMSIRQAYEKFPDRAEAYRAALRSQAERLGIDPQLVGTLRRPVLVRRLERDHSREVRQQLVSALNDGFTDRRESRAAGKSRGARLSVRTLDALASGLREADSLRQYFDTPASAAVVEMLVSDGVLQRTERNAFIGPDGLLNPDGKRLVEEALRGRVAGSYEALAAMPGQILAKIDAAIPHLLIAENVGGAWDITRHLRDAIDLLAEYRAAGAQDAELFLARTDMLREGKAPSERYSQAAQQLFRMAIGMKKAEFVGAFARYAAHAKASPEAGGMPGATLPQAKAAETFLGILPKRDKAADVPRYDGNDTGRDTQEAGHVERRSGEMPLASLGTPERSPDSTPVKVVEVEPGSVPEFKKARELAAWLKAYFAGRREETILSTGKRVRFGNGNLEASLKRGRESAHNQAYGALHNLVRQAEYDSFEGSDARHPHLGGQEVYYSALRIGDKLYAVKMKFDIPSDKESRYRKDTLKEKDIEDLRYKDHTLREMEIAPVLYREPARNTTGFTQTTGAIDSVSLGVLRDAVKPTRLEEGALSSVQAAGRHLPPPREVFRSPGAEAIRKAVEALDQRAVHAADVRVVEDMRDLPAGLREAFAAQTGRVEGMYDPATDTVWLVAGNLESVERAVEVWAHENLVHHGLRAVFTPQQRRVLLNQLWQATGGMGNDMARAIARRYGKDPRGNEADRLLVMEEVLARLAERRAQGLLTEQETGWWRKVVQAVLRAWKKLVQSVSGREGRMDAARMERLLDALQGHVMDGRSARTAEMLEEDGPLASLPAAEREKAHAAWEQVRKDTEAWERQVDAFVDATQTRKLLTVCRTPDVLRKLGAPDLPMSMTARNLEKILSDKPDHQLPRALVKQLPAALAEPVMVFESATAAESFVVLTELKHEGRSVMVAVHLDTERQNIRVNDIASAYRRGNEAWYIRQVEEGRLLYQDKKKSLAWARTNRLQLPQVRKLPARLSGNKILDETDVVKPIAPEADGPLASLSEEVASGVRVLRGIMGRGVSEDVADILANKEMGRLVPSQDMGLLERLFKLPHWVAKDHAGFAAVYERQLKRVEERSAALKQALETLPLLFDPDAGKRLRDKELEELAALIWKWDGKPIPALKDVDKFLVREKLPNGRALLRTNPAYRERFREWLRDEPGAERVKQGFLQVRDALDEAFVRAYNRMAGMADLAETDLELYRTEFGSLHNYFPHQRRGRYYVAAFRDGETVFRKHFDVPPGSSVREEWARIVAAHRKEHPGAHWAPPRETEKLPDDILGAPIDPQAMEQIIMAAARRLGGDAKQTAQVRETLLAGVADILKARGFGAHGIRRQHIPGFETEDIKGVLHAYLAGLNGWLTKMDAAADFAQALGRIDAVKTPRLWEYASQYSKDMLRNSDRIDRITGNIKTVAFAWYLGGNIKTAVVNLTQNLIVGIPRLERYVTGGGGYWLKSAADTIGLRYSGKGLRGARGLSPEEADMLQELYGNNVITDAYMDEIRGQIASSPSLRLWERFVRLLGKPMSMVEVFNRASLALAAYRAARRGAFKAGAAAELGLAPGRKMTHEQARDFAAMLVRDTHFEYGRGNQPEFLRSNTAGRLLSPLFTFRSFGANILNLWWLALRHEGREGRAFVARSLAATVALGGLTAFPFYATLSALCTAASGDDEDWTTKIRQALPQDDLLRDVVCYGLPAVAGVNIGGSLRMETPFTEGMRRGGTFKEAMTESLGALLGIPYDLAVNKPSKALEAHRFGEDAKAVEALVPTFMANLMQAWRLATEGQTTLRGRPLNRPGQPGARRLTPAEAVGKALGFQPTSSAKSFEAYAADKLRTQVRSDRIDIFVNQALDDLDSKGRPYMMRELRKRLTAWNAEMG